LGHQHTLRFFPIKTQHLSRHKMATDDRDAERRGEYVSYRIVHLHHEHGISSQRHTRSSHKRPVASLLDLDLHVIPLRLEHVDLPDQAVGDGLVVRRDHPPRHQVKRSACNPWKTTRLSSRHVLFWNIRQSIGQ